MPTSFYYLLSWFGLLIVIGFVLCEVRAEGKVTFFLMKAVCVLFDLPADSEQTVDYRAWSIVNIDYKYLWDVDCKFFPLRCLDDILIVNPVLW
jgi:hypothetical protein